MHGGDEIQSWVKKSIAGINFQVEFLGSLKEVL
jgi:hypothetical protein